MKIRYNPTTQRWTTEEGLPAKLPCFGLAIVAGGLYTRTEDPEEPHSYILEPCDEGGLYDLMTSGLGYVSYCDFGGDLVEAILWLNELVLSQVQAHREDFLIDLSIIQDLRFTNVNSVTYVLGLRNCGVDGPSFIRSRSQSDYRRILLVRIYSDNFTEISTMYKLEED